MSEEQQRYERARSRARALREFYTHAGIYVMVNAILFVVNAVTGGGWWFYWPLLFWGIGLGIHAIGVFWLDRLSDDWEERKARELMEKEER